MSPEKLTAELDRQPETHLSLNDMGRFAITGGELEVSDPTPKDYQQQCLDLLKTMHEKGESRALVSMATGLGKTWVAGFDVKSFLEEKPDARVLFLAHQNEILNQAAKTFTEIIGEHSQGFFHGGNKEYGEVTTLFASFQAMAKWHEAFRPDEFDYIVVDESHHSHAPTYRPVVEHFEPDFLLAVTATPDRHDMQDIRQIFGKEKYSLQLEEALAKGYLAKVDYRVITDDIQEEEKIRVLEGRIHSIQELNRTVFVPKRDEEIARITKEHAEPIGSPKRIVFCPSIEYTEHMATYFDNAAPLHSGLSTSEQNRYIEAFKSGDLETLLVVDMFNEGIDIPEANQIVFLRSTQSKTIFLQQLGRGLRKTADKQSVQVLDFVANAERLVYVNEMWQKIHEIQREPQIEDKARLSVDPGYVAFDECAINILDLITQIQGRYSRDALIAQLQQLSEHLQRTPKSADVTEASKEGRTVSLTMFQRAFGSWNEALTQAGFSLNLRQGVSEERMLQELRDFTEELGRVPNPQDMEEANRQRRVLTVQQYVKTFGGWTKALELAGLREKIVPPDEGQLIEDLKVLAEQLGHTPTMAEINTAKKQGQIQGGMGVYVRTFGSLTKAHEKAGLRSNRLPNVSDEELLQYLSDYTEQIGHVPTTKELNEAAKDRLVPHASIYVRRFGGLHEALSLAGLQPKYAKKGVTIEQVEEQVKALAEELGHPPTITELQSAFKEGKVVSTSTIHNLGGRKALYERLGFEDAIPKKMNNLSKEEIITQLQTLATEIGRRPTKKDIKAASKAGRVASYTLIAKRFGTFNAAIQESGLSGEQ